MKLQINQDVLKIIAVFLMTLDHVSRIIYGMEDSFFILLGRVVYPIFGWLIALHLVQKSVYTKYLKRLFFFGMITFCALLPFGVYDTLLWSFMVPIASLWQMEKVSKTVKNLIKRACLNFLIFVVGLILSLFLYYSLFGFLYIVTAYYVIKKRLSILKVFMVISGALLNPTVPLFAFVSGVMTAGLMSMNFTSKARVIQYKYLLYIYYPVHLFVLHCLKTLHVF